MLRLYNNKRDFQLCLETNIKEITFEFILNKYPSLNHNTDAGKILMNCKAKKFSSFFYYEKVFLSFFYIIYVKQQS